MTSHIELPDLRNEVLRKIGRNVVNFQKMEGMLKLLNSLNSVSGSLSDIQEITAKNSSSVKRQPMGRLADAFIREVYSDGSKNIDAQKDIHNLSISFSFRIDAAPELAKERKKALSFVVAERNKLIHQTLAKFDPSSIDSCVKLSTILDDQHEKIWPEFEILRSMVNALMEHHDELRRYLTSDEFLDELKRGDPGE